MSLRQLLGPCLAAGITLGDLAVQGTTWPLGFLCIAVGLDMLGILPTYTYPNLRTYDTRD